MYYSRYHSYIGFVNTIVDVVTAIIYHCVHSKTDVTIDYSCSGVYAPLCVHIIVV